jgi:SpoVK/Ycf46/Vps4 family AAA+-type ATPase
MLCPQLLDFDGSAAAAVENQRRLADKLNRPEIATMEFDPHEAKFLTDVVGPNEMDVAFSDIGGISEVLDEVRENVLLPLELLGEARGNMNLTLPIPTGVLLYGAPGTGKTMCAKAIAKEANATFILVKPASILSKWYGEPQKLTTAIFSLARKLAPTVLFIDEIDTLLSSRSDGPGSATQGQLQGVLLQEWDGLSTDATRAAVLVLGSTNRPQDLDPAIQRRLPLKILTPAPDEDGRLDILTKQLDLAIVGADVDLRYVAGRAEDFTGSDLRELCRLASLPRMKEFAKAAALRSTVSRAPPRQLCANDFDVALERMAAARHETEAFSQNSSSSRASLNFDQIFEKILNT